MQTQTHTHTHMHARQNARGPKGPMIMGDGERREGEKGKDRWPC